jgi:hypothetical protein
MKIAKTTEKPIKPSTKSSGFVAYLYAFILIVMALSQLFAFDKYINHFESFNLPGGLLFAHVLPSVIVTVEVLAVPFLLRIHLSELMKVISMMLGWVVGFIWLQLSLLLVLKPNSVENIGIFGTKVTVTPSWWVVFFSVLLLIMSIWASWGLWPIKISSRKVKKS